MSLADVLCGPRETSVPGQAIHFGQFRLLTSDVEEVVETLKSLYDRVWVERGSSDVTTSSRPEHTVCGELEGLGPVDLERLVVFASLEDYPHPVLTVVLGSRKRGSIEDAWFSLPEDIRARAESKGTAHGAVIARVRQVITNGKREMPDERRGHAAVGAAWGLFLALWLASAVSLWPNLVLVIVSGIALVVAAERLTVLTRTHFDSRRAPVAEGAMRGAVVVEPQTQQQWYDDRKTTRRDRKVRLETAAYTIPATALVTAFVTAWLQKI